LLCVVFVNPLCTVHVTLRMRNDRQVMVMWSDWVTRNSRTDNRWMLKIGMCAVCVKLLIQGQKMEGQGHKVIQNCAQNVHIYRKRIG